MSRDAVVIFDARERLANDRGEMAGKRQIRIGGIEVARVRDKLRPLQLKQLARDLIRDRQVV